MSGIEKKLKKITVKDLFEGLELDQIRIYLRNALESKNVVATKALIYELVRRDCIDAIMVEMLQYGDCNKDSIEYDSVFINTLSDLCENLGKENPLFIAIATSINSMDFLNSSNIKERGEDAWKLYLDYYITAEYLAKMPRMQYTNLSNFCFEVFKDLGDQERRLRIRKDLQNRFKEEFKRKGYMSKLPLYVYDDMIL